MEGAPDAPDDPGFAPADLTDGHPPFDWPTRWPKEAKRGMRLEAAYVALVFGTGFYLTYVIWARSLQPHLKLDDVEYATFERYSFAFLGGLLGGTLFDLKWLYHSVAKGKWHQDRRYWRLFTPFISAGLAFSLALLGSSGLIPLLDAQGLKRSSAMTMGLSFLVGYFSDNTIAAMARLSDRIFGEKEAKDAKHGGEEGQER